MKMTQEKRFVGIDVSKLWLDIAIWPTAETFRIANDRNGWHELARRLGRLGVQLVGLEASGGYERGVLRALVEANLPARLVNPWRARQFAQACGSLAKNDRLDAVAIAWFVSTVPPRPLIHSSAVDDLAELVTTRRQLVDELTRATNQAEHARQTVVSRLAKRRIGQLRAEILLLDKAIAAAVANNPEMSRKSALMRSVPGVGPVFTQSLLALMPELGSLTNRQAASLLGVAPFDFESGTFKGQRHIFGGRRALRDVAFMAAMIACRCNPVFKAFSQKLRDAGKRPKVAIVAVMRKLIVTLNAMLREGQPWRYAQLES
jgi:transposase